VTAPLLLRGARSPAGAEVDVRVERGRIAAVEPAGAAGAAGEVLDLRGHVLLPALAEPHAHLDKAYTADLFEDPAPDLLGAIGAWHAHRRTLSVDDIQARARRAALAALERGVTAIRSHVDVGEGIELRGVQALVALREELRGLVDLQVAPLTYPLTGAEGEENRELLREALALGADTVGGAPHLDADPAANLRWTLELAREHGRDVDLHMDEHLRGDLDLPVLAALVADGFPGAVAASHCCSLGMAAPELQDEVAGALARAGIAVVTLPLTNLYLQGRGWRTATPRGLTALPALLAAGVEVAGGGDNVQDPFNPLGCGDPLHTAQLLVAAGHLPVEQAVGLVTAGARTAMALPPLRLEPGHPADLVAIAGASLREVVAGAPEERIVIRAGRVVARTRVARERAEAP
jgi:cytosine deaminase